MATLPTGKWLRRKIKNIDNDRLNKHLDVMVEESGKSRLAIRWAIFWSFLTRGTSYTDFFRCNFLELTSAEKDTFFTARSFYKFVNTINPHEYEAIFHDKLVFNAVFAKYLKREYINLRTCSTEELERFLSGKDIVFAKPPTGEGGHDIEKIEVASIEDIAAFHSECAQKGLWLLEEAIIQHKDLNEINPNVVNSFRIVTLVKDGVPHIVGTALRVNQDETQIIGCTNDLYFGLKADGTIDGNVVDDYGKIWKNHPLTGKPFSEVKISGVAEAFELVKQAALEVPEMPYIGWDVAFSVNGPLIVEGNEYPGYGLIQFYKQRFERTGHKKTVEDILGYKLV